MKFDVEAKYNNAMETRQIDFRSVAFSYETKI